MAMDGVVRDHMRRPIPEGRRLAEALGRTYKLILVTDANDVEADKIWLQMENIKAAVDVMPGVLATTLRGDDERVAQITLLRARGEHVVLLVDSDPERIAAAFQVGITGLLFAHPGVMRPEFRPDWEHKPQPWADLVAEMEQGRYLASQLEPDEVPEDD